MLWLAILLTCFNGSSLWANPKILPPELDDRIYLPIEDLDEQALWLPRTLGSYHTIYRLTISGIACQSYTFRINEFANGRAIGTAKRWNRCKSDEPYEQRNFRIRAAELRNLKQQFVKARLWDIHPQFWQSPDDEICVDGEEMVFERLGLEGYRIAQANAQCEAPAKLIAAARMLVALANERRALALLPRIDATHD
ncbi:MAG: hypothetical protein LBV50_05310 [Novosphingobium sp.]|jgi:hypothetical protein|nr:hypothetical protein [Novosphingobium sp.]